MYFFFLDINENGKSKTLVVSLSLTFSLLFIAAICLLRVGYEYFKKRKINGTKKNDLQQKGPGVRYLKQVKQWQRKTWQRWVIRKTTIIMNVILGLEILLQSFYSKVFGFFEFSFILNFHFQNNYVTMYMLQENLQIHSEVAHYESEHNILFDGISGLIR